MKKILGVPLVMVVIGLVVIGGAMAALVNYLSNTVSANTEVSSPIEAWFDIDGKKEFLLNLPNARGGDEVNFRVYSRNFANQDIPSYPIYFVKGPAGTEWTGEEFTEVWFEDANGAWPILDMLYHVRANGDKVKLTDLSTPFPETLKLLFDKGDAPYLQEAGVLKWNELTLTLHPLIHPGEYSFEHCHLYELTGTCAAPGEPVGGWTNVQEVTSSELSFSTGGWAGWSCPTGTTVIGGGYLPENANVAFSGPAKPGEPQYPVYPHHTFSDGETGWVVQAGDEAPLPTHIVVYCADN